MHPYLVFHWRPGVHRLECYKLYAPYAAAANDAVAEYAQTWLTPEDQMWALPAPEYYTEMPVLTMTKELTRGS